MYKDGLIIIDEKLLILSLHGVGVGFMLILVPKILSQINVVQNTKFPKKIFCPIDADICQKMKNLG